MYEHSSSVIAEEMPTPSPSSSSSPADKVASNDDLLMEILSRLPVRSLLRSMSISKHWYSLITNPSFKLRSPNPDPPSGLFVPVPINKPYLICEFVPFDIENPIKAPFRTLSFDPNVKRIGIEHSSNGLMLCSSLRIDVIEENMFLFTWKYYIYNPTIKKYITLPPLEKYDKSDRCGMTIAFDPSLSPHYRIIYVCGLGTDYDTSETDYQTQIYFSRTGTCKSSCQFSLHEDIDMTFRAGVYWNNAIHWISRTGFVLYFNLDKESIHQIQTPLCPIDLDATDYLNYIFESRDHLLLVEFHGPLTSKFKIHELKRDYSGWSVKYHVDLEEVGGSFPEILNPENRFTFDFTVLSLVLGEKEDDSFLVLEIPGKALRFNLVSRTFHKLHDFTASRSSRNSRVICQWPYVFQFMESLYCV